MVRTHSLHHHSHWYLVRNKLTISSVVFSTWRLSLDLVEAGLNRDSIGNVRFDGKVPQKERQGVVDRFKTDPAARVMLLTLSCGAVGFVPPPMPIPCT